MTTLVPSRGESEVVLRDRLSCLQSLLALSMLMTESGDQDHILRLAATSVPSLANCRFRGVHLIDAGWEATAGPCVSAAVQADIEAQFALLGSAGGALSIVGEPWGWAFPLRCLGGRVGHFVVGGDHEPSEAGRFMLGVLVQGTAVALANASLRARERTTAEDRRAALEEELRQAQKMDAIGRLAGGLAHNFGNLLTTIDIYTELALGNVDDEQSRGSLRNNLEEVRRASGRAADLVRRLLVFSRRQQLPPRVVDLKLVFDNLMGMLRPVIGEHITIATRFARDLGYVKANIGELEEVIVNLAANARDAMPDGGVLTFEAKNMVLHHTDALRLGVTAGSYSALSVSDTGEGIATDALDHIFEPFFTTKDIGRGTGLGLYMAHNVMRQNAGSIDVASSPGRGATFTILLPHVPEASEAEPAPAEPDQRGNGETILVVEDDEHLRISVERILTERGYRVLAAGSAEDGLALLEAREQPIDLLVSDLVLPGMSGFELAIPAQLQQPGLRTLFISGYPPQLTSRGRGPTAAAPIVQKPFTAATLARAVRDSLDARGLEEFRASP